STFMPYFATSDGPQCSNLLPSRGIAVELPQPTLSAHLFPSVLSSVLGGLGGLNLDWLPLHHRHPFCPGSFVVLCNLCSLEASRLVPCRISSSKLWMLFSSAMS